jgi:3-isopropylmalate/(R)-2-methylmalate dehydratase small subunit
MIQFTQLNGVVAPLLRTNVDTDAIIPSREMKRVSKHGLGEGLFAGWRYLDAKKRIANPEFVLNAPEYVHASILLSGENFGCGSSREHAAWALSEYGIRAIIAPSFGSIFKGNCSRNGILPIVLSDQVIQAIADQVRLAPQENQVTINLPEQTLTCPNGEILGFEIEAGPKEMLVEGLDPIALTQRLNREISDFEGDYQLRRPWLFEAK